MTNNLKSIKIIKSSQNINKIGFLTEVHFVGISGHTVAVHPVPHSPLRVHPEPGQNIGTSIKVG